MVNLCGRLTALYALIVISSQNRLTYSTCHIPSSSRTGFFGVFLAAISTLNSHIHAGLVRVFGVKRTKTRHSDYDISPTARLSQGLGPLTSATLSTYSLASVRLSLKLAGHCVLRFEPMRPFSARFAAYRPFGRVFSVLRFFRAIGINHLLESCEYFSIAKIIPQEGVD